MNGLLAIVGAGPAGLAAAIMARLHNLEVLVIDPHTPPIDKACGEGIMPHGVRVLHELGVELGAGRPFMGIRFVDHNVTAEAQFLVGHGWAMRRTALSQAMYQRACAVGVRFLLGVRAQKVVTSSHHVELSLSNGHTLSASWLLAADGLHSTMRRHLGYNRVSKARRRFGVRCHYQVPPWSSFVEVHFAQGAEAYVTPTAHNEVGIAVLSNETPLSFDTALQKFSALNQRVHHATRSSTPRGAGPFLQPVRQRQEGRALLIGDAAGYVDPITGEGLSLAFRTAQAAIAHLLQPGSNFNRRVRVERRPYEAFTRLMLWLGRHPHARRKSFAYLQRHPQTFAHLLAISMGELTHSG